MNKETAATIQAFRDKLASRSYVPLSVQQQSTTKDTPAKGPLWVSRVKLPPPAKGSICDKILGAIRHYAEEAETYIHPTLTVVEGEWVGLRKHVGKQEPEPQISEKEKFDRLLGDTSSKVTIFYIHGGTFCTGCPATVRPVTSVLATITGGRCFALKYRLSPQNAFPGALVDAFMAYMALIHPPPESFHTAVDPSCITFASDSCGGTLVLALVQLIRYIRRDSSEPSVEIEGVRVEVPFPAGVACLCPQADQTHALPSYAGNGHFDVYTKIQPCLESKFPACSIWPSNPPRGDVYCDISSLSHPLVSPATARSWRGVPPMWMAYGTERLLDDGALIAQKASEEGVTVQFSEYDQLPHIFPMLFPKLPQSAHLIKSWAKFISDCVYRPESIRPVNKKFEADGTDTSGTDRGHYSNLKFEAMLETMRKQRDIRMVWAGPASKTTL